MADTQHYFNVTNSDSTEISQSSQNVLPSVWYSSQEMYEFERRAIFSKRWMFIAHKSRLTQTGDWIRYSFACYDIIITLDRTGTFNAFHNVCRHRAYPVIEKEGFGNNKILACRYHGWSYGLNGKLAKAPGYQEMNLDKDQNSLFRCHTKIDQNGFIWINMDAKETPEIGFDTHFANVDARNKTLATNFNDYTFGTELKKENLQFNWKHASAGTPPADLDQNSQISNTYYFPNAASTVTPQFMAIEKILPQGPDKTTKHYEIYRHKDCSDEDWNNIKDAYTGALEAEKGKEFAPAMFQTLVRAATTEHYKQEKTAGREIWPSRPVHSASADQADEDEEICAGLACGAQKEVLAW